MVEVVTARGIEHLWMMSYARMPFDPTSSKIVVLMLGSLVPEVQLILGKQAFYDSR